MILGMVELEHCPIEASDPVQDMLQYSSSVVPLPKYDPPYGIAPVNWNSGNIHVIIRK